MGLKRKSPVPPTAPKIVPKRPSLSEDLTVLKELISRRRRQILVHSEVYYRMNDSIIDDQTFDKWSRELVKLQADHPEAAAECVFHALFMGFDGTTGFHLCGDPWAVAKAAYLLQLHRKGATA